ncbi:hypothetical protein RA955_17385 [Geobacillus proteiniphilus]|uniref:Uncharacterized protein n=1 Tax=Geobacillus proteiniphilus TaxID=860353 RepID=A0ABY9MEB9_9BACL|nr:hypothetical protein [Geobacillus proteiniphilus]WMJ16377.1 hypothetical protein RA955_17385 [Geobacillus proteiniphilus]
MALQWLEQFVKYQGLSREFWNFIDREGINRKDLDQQLEQYKLDTFSRRAQFLWKLQSIVEKVVFEYVNEQNNSDVADLVAKEWNLRSYPEIDKFIARAMIDRLPIRHDTMKKAFQAICNGHFLSYELYAQGNQQLFVQLFVRTTLLLVDHPSDVVQLGEIVLPSLFQGIDTKGEIMKALHSLLMTRKDGLADYKAMHQYGQLFSPDELVFNQGMLRIIIPILKEKKQDEVAVKFLHNIGKKVSHLIGEEMDLIDMEPENKEEQSEEISFAEGAQETYEKSDVQGKEATVALSSAKHEMVQRLIMEVDEFSARIKGGLEMLEQQLAYPIGEDYAPHEEYEEVIARLKEENQRLYIEMEKIRKKQAENEWRRFKQFVQAVGGSQHHYLLSELYEESQGRSLANLEMTKGRLMNLFNALSLFGVEPTTYGYSIGQELTVTRQELRERFMMLQPIASSTDEVRVKIVRCGWTIYGQVIVQPLVEEMKES